MVSTLCFLLEIGIEEVCEVWVTPEVANLGTCGSWAIGLWQFDCRGPLWSPNQSWARAAFSTTVCPPLLMHIRVACSFTVKLRHRRFGIKLCIVLDDPWVLAGSSRRRWTVVAVRLGREMDVQMKRAPVSVVVGCTVGGVDSIDNTV